jgi:hypothetical protein
MTNSGVGAVDSYTVKGYVDWNSQTGYWWSQADPSASNREAGLWILSGSIRVYVGGTSTILGNVAALFGSTRIFGFLELEVDLVAATATIKLDDVVIVNAAAITVNTTRVDLVKLRIGGRSSSATPPNDTGAYLLASSDRVSDLEITRVLTAGGTDVRNYEMPSTGVTVVDTIGAVNGTLQSPASPSEDNWELFTPPVTAVISPPSVGFGLFAIEVANSNQSNVSLTGAYDVGYAATSITYRVLKDSIEVVGPTAVDSFSAGEYSLTVDLSGGRLYQIELTATDGATTEVSDLSDNFTVADIIAFTGSSSAQLSFSQGSLAISAGLELYRVSITGTVTYIDSGNAQGSAVVARANALYEARGNPVVLWEFGVGATRISTGWAAGQSLHQGVLDTLEPYGCTIVDDQSGYNDAAGSDSLSELIIADMYDSYRAAFNCIVITGTTQRRFADDRPEFTTLWQHFDAVVNSRSWLYRFNRMDLEISGDNIHLLPDEATIGGHRAGQIAAYATTGSGYYLGPRITSSTYLGTTVNVNLSATGTDYTTITPATGIAGFQLEDDTGIHTLSSVVVTSKNLITITLSRAIAGTLLLRFAGYNGNTAGASVSAYPNYPLADSSVSMPIEPRFSDLTVSEFSDSGVSFSGLNLGIGIGLGYSFGGFSAVAPIQSFTSDFTEDFR